MNKLRAGALCSADDGGVMTYTQNLWLYFTLLFGIILVPGMDMFFVLANTLTNGRRAGLAATAGIMLGGAVHCAYVALGIGLVAEWLPVVQQGLVIGLMTILTQFLIYGGLAVAAGGGRDFLLNSPRATIFIGRGAGVIFLLAACLTVLEGLFGTL